MLQKLLVHRTNVFEEQYAWSASSLPVAPILRKFSRKCVECCCFRTQYNPHAQIMLNALENVHLSHDFHTSKYVAGIQTKT